MLPRRLTMAISSYSIHVSFPTILIIIVCLFVCLCVCVCVYSDVGLCGVEAIWRCPTSQEKSRVCSNWR